jgi:hypothetical protein
VRAARAAGLTVLATPSLYSTGDDLSEAHAVLPDLGDPEQPWPRQPDGYRQAWVEYADLERLLERTTVAMAA